MPVIEVSHLTKAFRTYKKQPGFAGAVKGLFHRQYEQTLAVNDVSFKIEPGELVGFLGPNGAGKTTTLKMLAGLLYPTSGAAKVLGYTPWERADGYRRQFALLLGQKNQLWWDLPARESLELNAKIYGIPKDRFERTVAEMSEMLTVRDKLNVSVRELSLGERMKMELIASLLHEPKVLFLDEPTIGLDPHQIRAVRQLIKSLAQKHTVLISTHILPEAEMTCNRMLIMYDGKILAADTPDNLQRLMAGSSQIIAEIAAPADELREVWSLMPGIEQFDVSPSEGEFQRCVLTPRDGYDLRPAIFSLAQERGWIMRELTRSRHSLEDIYVQVTKPAEEEEGE